VLPAAEFAEMLCLLRLEVVTLEQGWCTAIGHHHRQRIPSEIQRSYIKLNATVCGQCSKV
jgi:hypothetical protein